MMIQCLSYAIEIVGITYNKIYIEVTKQNGRLTADKRKIRDFLKFLSTASLIGNSYPRENLESLHRKRGVAL